MNNNELRQALVNMNIELTVENSIILKSKIKEELNIIKKTSKAI